MTAPPAAQRGVAPESPRRRDGVLGSPVEVPTPPAPAASLKGGSDGLRVVVRSEDPAAVVAALEQQIAQRSAGFFDGASVELELNQPAVSGALVAAICDLLDQNRIALTSVGTSSGGPPRERRAAPAGASAPAETHPDIAAFVARTLRSGQRTEHAGSVVVLGDVNVGAEVRAGGSVVVWGRLRGSVEAGLDGGEAVVCALDLSPAQLRIGDALARAPDGARSAPVPEVARRVGAAIVVEPWG